MYADVNRLFGDIVKVTPSSKAVGDMALFLVTNDLTVQDVLDSNRELAFPESVVDLMAGRMGQPPGGFPPLVRDRILRNQKPLTGRPGAEMPPVDPMDLVRMIAVARVLMPKSRVRLSAGRTSISREGQMMCLYAGANSIFYGEKLLTTPNPAESDDLALLRDAGLSPMAPARS